MKPDTRFDLVECIQELARNFPPRGGGPIFLNHE